MEKDLSLIVGNSRSVLQTIAGRKPFGWLFLVLINSPCSIPIGPFTFLVKGIEPIALVIAKKRKFCC